MDKKIVVITGASGGIGAALAKLLGSKEHGVVLGARREKELAEVARESGTGAVPVVTDVTRRADVEHLKEVALGTFGRVDVWVNNAGRGITRSVLELSDEDVDQIIAVNLKSALYGMQAILPHFLQRGKGHLINVSSFLGRVPLAPVRSIYSAAKAGLNVLTAGLRMDLREKYPDIHVSLVMPGVVLDDFGRNALYGTPQWRPGSSGSPMKGQTPEDVAAVIESVIERPESERYTNPALSEIARRYYEDVDAFETGPRP